MTFRQYLQKIRDEDSEIGELAAAILDAPEWRGKRLSAIKVEGWVPDVMRDALKVLSENYDALLKQ